MRKYTYTIVLLFFAVYGQCQERNLDYYLRQARDNSPLINSSKNQALLADLDLETIRSVVSKPEVNVESSVLFAPIISHKNNKNTFEWVSNGADNYTGYDLAVTDGGQYQAMVTFRQPLFTGAVYKTYSDKTDISKKISENKIALTGHELDQLVRYQYLLCIKSAKEINISDSLLTEMKNQLVVMKKLTENAIYKQTDLMLLEIETRNIRAANEQFKSAYKTNLYDLNLVCGIADTTIVQLADPNLTINADTVSQSSFLDTYRLESLNILNNLKISNLKYKPNVAFFANAGVNATYLPAFNRMGFSTGITFSWNIFDGHQKSISEKKSMINLQTVSFEKNNFRLKNQLQKQKILDQIRSVQQQIMLGEEQLNQYRLLLKAYYAELPHGEVSVMDLKNILRDMYGRQQENIRLTMEKQVLINAYNYWNY